jgi:hypothetical protein
MIIKLEKQRGDLIKQQLDVAGLMNKNKNKEKDNEL